MKKYSHQNRILSQILLLLLVCFSNAFSFSLESRSRIKFSRNLKMSIENFDALLFDCDGVIAETERDIHRISFNEAFKSKGLSNSWSVDEYGELLRIGGGEFFFSILSLSLLLLFYFSRR